MSQSRLAAIGVFVAGGVVLFAVGLFMIGDRRLLFAEQFELSADFNKVTGLEVGTTVRVAGLDAGEVLSILLPSAPSDKFVVTMRVREDLHPLVRTDSTCSIQTDGIVGSAFIQIARGTDAAPMVPPGGRIKGNDPIEFADLIEEGRNTFRTVTQELLEVKEDVSGTLKALTETAGSANDVVVDLGADLQVMTRSATGVADQARVVLTRAGDVITEVKNGRGTVGRLLTDDALYTRVSGAAQQAEQTAENLRKLTDQARQAFTEFTADEGPGPTLVGDLRSTLTGVQELLSDLGESTEALKRNFLFRGYFAERGFYDLDSLTADEYRGGALERGQRTALRIWLQAGQLFVEDAQGREQLTDSGRRRIDSAMADFLRYPRDSLLVVEGYATGDNLPAQLLRADDRALAVRGYLVDRFRREVTLTGTMPLGSDAPGSPSGDGRWSGIALTLFVPTSRLSGAGP